jgi:GAF domain-containing protein
MAALANDTLESLRCALNADRAYVFEFHNGSSNATGVPYLKLSNTYERCKYGIVPQILNLQNLPVGVGYLFIKCIALNQDICVHDIEMLRDNDPSTYMLLATQSVKSLYATGILHEDKPVGFVGVDYCSHKHTLTSDESRLLRETAYKLCGMLLTSTSCSMTSVVNN